MSRSLPSPRRQLFPTPRKSASRRTRPAFELLEQRLVMSTYVVNTFVDQIDPPGSSIVSLRDALALAASHAGPDTIDVPAGDYYLNIDGALQIKDTSGAVTIQVTGGTALIDGVYSDSGILEVAAQTTVVASGLTINQAYGGDGVANYGTLTMTNCRITNVTGGSGIYNKGTLHLTDVVIDNTGNLAQVSGGIYNAGTMTMTNGTLFGDTGGAIFNSGTATVTDSTLYDNDTGIDTTGSFTIGNTIVGQDAYSVYTGFPDIDVSNMDVTGAVKSLGGNLISDTVGSSGWIASDKTGTTAAPLGPQLANVSPSAFYIPLAGSPALGSGKIGVIPSGVTTDGRGLPRVVNGKVDIGAVEVQGATPIHVTPPAPQSIAAVGNSPVVKLGSFTAPAGTGPFSGLVEWGDGTVTFLTPTATGAIAAQVHRYPKPGNYTGSIALTDTAGDLSNPATLSVSFVAVPSPSIVVNTTKDQIDPAGSKTVSLRDAIAKANAGGGATITFDPKVFATHQLISLAAANGGLELSEIFGSINIVGPAAGVSIGGPNVGDIFIVDYSVTATLSGLTVQGGGTSFQSFDAAITNGGDLTIRNSTITGNLGIAIQNGGVVDNFNGAVYPHIGTLLLEDSTVSDNSDGGAGILNDGAATIIDCNISDNSGIDGGAANTASGNARPLFLGPPMSAAAGIYNDGTLTLTNSTMSGNSNAGAGAILNDDGGTATISDCTITANNSSEAVVNHRDSTLVIANTIIAGNTSTVPSADVWGIFNSLGHNLIGEVDSNSSGWTKSDLTGTDAHPLNPKLSALGNFSGPTESIVPLAGSPALQAGSVALIPKGVTTDQRGLPRVIGGKVDIGATEINKAGPFSGTPAPFGLIQAENFDYGGQGVGYFNPDNTNRGGLYRPTEGVGIGAIPNADGGGYFVGWTLPGESLDYTVSVNATGTYNLNFRVASQPKGGTFHLNVDGKNVTGELSVPSTGNWNVYTTISKTGVNLTAGTHVLQLVIDSSGTGTSAAGNFDWIQAVPAPNLLANGNFSAGNTGFTSQYPNTATPGGGYLVGSTPSLFDPTWLDIGDHTTGTGLMMEVDASTVPNTFVWEETIKVTADTSYSFSGWAADLHTLDTNVPDLAFYVNNVQIGTTFAVPSNPGRIWSSFWAAWNSGSAKTATIKIVDLDTAYAGNDFAIDDLTFGV